MENNFVYFLHAGANAIEIGQSYGKYLFIIDESGDVSQVVNHHWLFLAYYSQDAAAGARTHVTIVK